MNSYQLIHQLLSLVERFEKENRNSPGTLQDFAGFLVNSLHEQPDILASSDIRFGHNEMQAQELAFQLDNNISRLVLYMNRYAKSYIKKALDGTQLQTPEDFTCLAILLTHDDLSKGDLISHNIQEKTSGTEVIRRLIAAGLVRQWNDKKDKRSRRISITVKGRKLLFGIFSHMSDVGKIVTGKLTLTEKLTLQFLLQKLEDFHFPIHENKSITSKEDLADWAKKLA